jgi:hypothetical protein
MGNRRTRPKTSEERADCLRAARDLLARRAVSAGVRRDVQPACDAFSGALRRYASARVREDRARPRAHAAAAAFEVAFRGWAGTVIDQKKRRDSARVAALLGGVLPGELPRRVLAERVARTAGLAGHIAADPSLRRVAGEVRDMLATRAALAEAVAALTAAEDARAHASAALARAARAFDRAWGVLVRAPVAPAAPAVARRSARTFPSSLRTPGRGVGARRGGARRTAPTSRGPPRPPPRRGTPPPNARVRLPPTPSGA